MRILFSAFLLTLMLPLTSQAENITCEITKHNAVLFENRLEATCGSEGVKIIIDGLGVGFLGFIEDADNNSTGKTRGLWIQCPLQNDSRGTYYGLKVSAAVFMGLDIGVFAGKEGACFMGGIGILGLGAAVNGVKLVIEQYSPPRSIYRW